MSIPKHNLDINLRSHAL
jgi:cation diffusion facilitator CzcD-associated flavoprotein CzcO